MLSNIQNSLVYIKASVNKHFTDGLPTTKVVVQGNLPSAVADSTYVEIRILESSVTKTSSNSGYIDLGINAIVQVADDDDNIYNFDLLIGQVSALFRNITVYEYGPDGDGSYIGCLELVVDGNSVRDGDLHISNFGRINPELKVQQAAVEATFRLRIGEQ